MDQERPANLIENLVPEQVHRNERRREQRAAQFFKENLARCWMSRAAIINRLALDLNASEREELRGLGHCLQERFLAVRAAAQTLETRLYDAVTSLEPRLTKNISTRAIRRDPARPLAGGRA